MAGEVVSHDSAKNFHFSTNLSWSRKLTPIRPENRPVVLFEKLFGSEDNNTLAAAKLSLAQRGRGLPRLAHRARLAS